VAFHSVVSYVNSFISYASGSSAALCSLFYRGFLGYRSGHLQDLSASVTEILCLATPIVIQCRANSLGACHGFLSKAGYGTSVQNPGTEPSYRTQLQNPVTDSQVQTPENGPRSSVEPFYRLPPHHQGDPTSIAVNSDIARSEPQPF